MPSLIDEDIGIDLDLTLEDQYQVVLYNDNHNTMERVVKALMQTFNHTAELAVKIMIEAHKAGRAVAEVEEKEKAQTHKDQLTSFGLTAEMEKI